MKFYALNYDWNKKKLYQFNIFDNIYFNEEIKKAIQDYNDNYNYNVFKETIRRKLQYCFWCKREYELFIGDAFDENLDNYEKVDVYSQVLPNLDILCNYILDNRNIIVEKK